MLPALIEGKLSWQQENMEDILTSNVFGTFQYLPPSDGILPFLAKAQAPDKTLPLHRLLVPDAIRSVQYEFWPALTTGYQGCEPDVIITITPAEGRSIKILIEAKFWSGKSSQGDEASPGVRDQLAREWVGLHHANTLNDFEPCLVYVTAHASFPTEEIKAAFRELSLKWSEANGKPVLLWASWRSIPDLFAGSNNLMLRDLVRALGRLGLTFFKGFSPFDQSCQCTWAFSDPATTTISRFDGFSPFGVAQAFNWQFETDAQRNDPWSFAAFPALTGAPWRFSP